MKKNIIATSVALVVLGMSQGVFAACSDITPGIAAAVLDATTTSNDGGYPLKFWITTVDETGKVCDVRTNGVSGAAAGNSEWLGSRLISAQKANTANAFSLDAYAISTANLYAAVQPGGSLYGLQHSNPVDASKAYGGSPVTYGTTADFLKNKRIGGVNVFGGGLALYKAGKKVGAVGVSGDTSCADHIFAWNVRSELNMEPYPTQQSAGLAGEGTGITTLNVDLAGQLQTAISGAVQGDEMLINVASPGSYWDAWSHPGCVNTSNLNAGGDLGTTTSVGILVY